MTPRPLAAAALLTVLALAPLAGCSRPEPARTPADAQARSQALIDSGNAAFKDSAYAEAAKRYAAATSEKPDDPAAWYGLGMALSRLGRDDEAREAYAKARGLLGRRDSAAVPAH